MQTLPGYVSKPLLLMVISQQQGNLPRQDRTKTDLQRGGAYFSDLAQEPTKPHFCSAVALYPLVDVLVCVYSASPPLRYVQNLL